MVILEFNNRFNGHEFQDNDSSPDIGPKIALWGALLAVLGDTISVIGGAISIEESNAADRQQQQILEKLQIQVDELQKGQSQNNVMPIDIKTFNSLLERMVEKLELLDDPQVNK